MSSREVKRELYERVMIPGEKYYSETWTLVEKRRKLEVFEIFFFIIEEYHAACGPCEVFEMMWLSIICDIRRDGVRKSLIR